MVDNIQLGTEHFSTLTEFLHWRAFNQPERIIFTWLTYLDNDEILENKLSFKEIDRKARSIAARLLQTEATGERALLLYPPGLDYILAFCGCLYAGVIAVPAYPPFTGRLLNRLQSIVSDSESKFVLTTSLARGFLDPQLEKHPELSTLTWMETDTLDDDVGNGFDKIDTDENSIAFLQYTSGSTADPKGPMITHANLLHNLGSMYRYFEGTSNNVGISWLPQYHDMGLVGCILASLYSDIPVVFLSPLDFLQKPIHWLKAISRYRGTISGAPNFAYNLCISKITEEQRTGLDLSSWDLAANAAEPVRADTIERFVRAFEPCGFRREAFKAGYGLAESTFLVTNPARGTLPVIERFDKNALEQNRIIDESDTDDEVKALVGCGKILPQGKIVIVDPNSLKECLPDKIGEIWVSSPSVAKGYWNRPDETRQTFGATLADTGEGPFLRTGDLGFLKNDELFITGRIKDLIILHGRNHYPQDIERTVEESSLALRLGCTAAFSLEIEDEEKLVVVQEIKKKYADADTGLSDIYKGIHRSIQEEHALDVYDIILIKAGNIPKTSSGKIQRRACRNNYLKNQLKVIGHYRENFNRPDTVRKEFEKTNMPEAQQIRSWLISNITQKMDNVDDATPELIVEIAIRQILSILLKLDPDEMESDIYLYEYGMNSLKMVEMDDHLQQLFGTGLAFNEWKEERTIRNLTAMLVSKPQIQQALEKRRFPLKEIIPYPSTRESDIEIPLPLNTGEILFLDFINLFARIFWRLAVKGIENLPLKEPFIICPNHESHLDSFVVACCLPRVLRRRLCTFAALKVFENGFHRLLSRSVRGIPTDRYGDQWPVLKIGERLLNKERVLLVFPEGRRTRDGEMNQFKGGAAYLSRKTGAPIVPVFIKGTGSIYPPENILLPRVVGPYVKKEQIELIFGSPINADGDSTDAITEKLHQSVIRLKTSID